MLGHARPILLAALIPDPVDPASRFLLSVLVWPVTAEQVKLDPAEPARSAA
jgi:hypothetical protein